MKGVPQEVLAPFLSFVFSSQFVFFVFFFFFFFFFLK
jgi:hypothetical protein